MTIMSHPGKIGDCLLAWPVVHQYAKESGEKVALWLDEGSLKTLVPLFEAQPKVEEVKLIPGVKHYKCGGQPWDMGLTPKDYGDRKVVHLGMRGFPQKQITLQTMDWVPLTIDKQAVSQSIEPMFVVPQQPWENRLILHGKFASHGSGVPGFWRFLARVQKDLETRFGKIVFIGTPDETQRAKEVYPDWDAFDDGGDFLKLASLIQASSAVIGCGSVGVVMGAMMRVPTIRVHDPIGEAPKVIWSNLGRNQLNETEVELRDLWPEWRDKWLTSKAEVA